MSSREKPTTADKAVQTNEINAKDILGLHEQMAGDLKNQTASVLELENRNENVSRYLLEETKYYEALICQQSKISDVETSWDMMRSRQENILMEARKQNECLKYEMEEQRKIISHLTQYHKEALGQFEQYLATMALKLEEQTKTIADLKCQKEQLGSNLEELSRIESSREKRELKVNEVTFNAATTILSELDYQQNLIDELKPEEVAHFQPTHDTLVDMVGIIEQWTRDDEEYEIVFNFEDDSSNFKRLYEDLLSRFNEQSCELKMQSIKICNQQRKIDEQNDTILELEAHNKRVVGDLEEQTLKLTSILDGEGENEHNASQIEQRCTELFGEREKTMKREIKQLKHRLRPLEGNVFNSRQKRFCNYLRINGSISATDASIMLDSLSRKSYNVDLAEIDARMFEERLSGQGRDYTPDFVRVYGILPSKFLNSSWLDSSRWIRIANPTFPGIMRHPFIARIFNEVGAIHLENRELTDMTNDTFAWALKLLEDGKYGQAINYCRRMPVNAKPMRLE
jgi:hypothetical protein